MFPRPRSCEERQPSKSCPPHALLVQDICLELAQFLDLMGLAHLADTCAGVRQILLSSSRTWVRHAAGLYSSAIKTNADALEFKRQVFRLTMVRRFWAEMKDVTELPASRIGSVYEEHMIAWHGYVATRNIILTTGYDAGRVVGSIPKHSELVSSDNWLVAMQRVRRSTTLHIARRPGCGKKILFQQLTIPTNRVWLVAIHGDVLVTHLEIGVTMVVRVIHLSTRDAPFDHTHYRRPAKLRHFGFWALAAHKRDFLLGHLAVQGACHIDVVQVPNRWITSGFKIQVVYAALGMVLVSLTSANDDRIECLDVSPPEMQALPLAVAHVPKSTLQLRWSAATQHPNNRTLIFQTLVAIVSNDDLFGECAVDIYQLDTGQVVSRPMQIPFGRLIQVSSTEFMITQQKFDQTLSFHRLVQETSHVAMETPLLWNISCIWRQCLYRVMIPPSLTQVAFVPTRASDQWHLVDVRSAMYSEVSELRLASGDVSASSSARTLLASNYSRRQNKPKGGFLRRMLCREV